MVEQVAVNDKVLGSSPSRGASYNSAPCYRHARKEFTAARRRMVPEPEIVKFYYAYVLHNNLKNFIYIGYSEDLKQRVTSHNKGENKSTKPYLPLELIHYEAYKNMTDAKRRELYLKSNRGRTTLMTMLKEYFEIVP